MKENYRKTTVAGSGPHKMRPGPSPNTQAADAHRQAAARGLPSSPKVVRDAPNLTGSGTVRQVSRDEWKGR